MNDDQQPGWVAPGTPQAAPGSPPPPGYPQPGYPQPGYPAQGYPAQGYPAQGYPPPGHPAPGYPAPAHYSLPYYRPAHKPGIVALRPLGLGDLYDGAFAAIRRNPKPMVGLAATVAISALLVPTLVTVLLAMTGDLALGLDAQSGAAEAMTFTGSALTALAGIVLAGMIVHVVMEATVGRKATIEATWRAVRGRMPHLVGLALLSSLAVVMLVAVPVAVGILVGATVGVVLGVLAGLGLLVPAVCALAFLWTRLVLLAAPAMVVERLGVFSAMGRAWQLSRGQFWRILGISLLTQVTVGFVGQILAVPLALVAVGAVILVDDATVAALVYVFANYVALVLVQSLTTPFVAAVQALQYVDQRIRKEAYDVELIARAQPVPATY